MSIRVEGQKTHLLPELDSSFDNEMKLANEKILPKKTKSTSSQISDKNMKLDKGTSNQDSNVDREVLAFIEDQIVKKTIDKLKEYQELRKEALDEE